MDPLKVGPAVAAVSDTQHAARIADRGDESRPNAFRDSNALPNGLSG